MSNQWLRLWHDMPTDPKWRTIARISNQPICSVISVYMHMLVCASNATERGRTHNWSDEDVASSLDLECSAVVAIREAMQGRVIDGDYLKGWEKRQPKREDNSATRAKEWRDAQKGKKDEERTRTQPNAKKRPDKNKNKKEYTSDFEALWKSYPRKDGSKSDAFDAYQSILERGISHETLVRSIEQFAVFHRAAGTEAKHLPHATTWLNGKRWEGDYTITTTGKPKQQISNYKVL